MQMNGLSSQIDFDDSKLLVAGVSAVAPFDNHFSWSVSGGRLTVNAAAASGVGVSLGGSTNPTPVFNVTWYAQNWTTNGALTLAWMTNTECHMLAVTNQPISQGITRDIFASRWSA